MGTRGIKVDDQLGRNAQRDVGQKARAPPDRKYSCGFVQDAMACDVEKGCLVTFRGALGDSSLLRLPPAGVGAARLGRLAKVIQGLPSDGRIGVTQPAFTMAAGGSEFLLERMWSYSDSRTRGMFVRLP